MEIAELFNQLESNQPEVVEEIKNSFHENFHSTKDSYLVNGLFDYYLSTSSLRCVDVLVGVREPHDKYLFDRISESLKSQSKVQALTLLGHIVRRHPAWIYKITNHSLMKELLKLLKVETDIVPLMSALLVLIVLLPMIPTLVGPFLQDIFDIFSRLAAWNTNNPNKLPEEHLLHLQVGLYALFHRLYGMYPCNFLSYLRHEYGQKENLGIFGHTIKPMLDTVRMHPLLVTASKDAETAATRWLRMEHHDVIVECSKFSLDGLDRNKDEVTYQSLTPLLSRYSLEHTQDGDHQVKKMEDASMQIPELLGRPAKNHTTSTSFLAESTSQQQGRGSVTYSQAGSDKEMWSPSLYCGMTTPPLPESVPASIPQTPNSQTYSLSSSLPHPEGTSPPEAAIEATPETTPIKDVRPLGRPAHPLNSNVARALTSFTNSGGSGKWTGLTSGNTTPSQSQPSSPMKKDLSPFRFPTLDGGSKSAFEQPRRDSVPSAFEQRRDSLFSQKVQRVQQDRIQMAAAIDSPTGDKQTPGSLRASTRVQVCQPTSPLRIISNEASIPSSPVHMESAVSTPGARDHIERTLRNGLGLDIADNINSAVQTDICQEDQEVLEIVRQGEQLRIDTQPKNICSTGPVPQRQCDSVLQEIHPPHVEEYEECQQESGSPCTSGGLHMPNSVSMLDFARRYHQHRHRYYSQCMPETKSLATSGFSAGSSPGEGSGFPIQPRVRRANSCPEMKKGPVLPGAEANVDKTLDEKEELEIEASNEDRGNKKSLVNGNEVLIEEAETKELVTSSTQTVDHWTPLPYEHLFMGVFPPSVEQSVHHHNGEAKPSPAPSPGPQAAQQHPEGFPRFSPFTILDKYIDTAVQGVLREDHKKPKGFETELKILKEQLTLLILQLQFERYRREVHAERNRRLLGKSRTNRALEEHNSALRDQLGLLQKEIENLHNEREKLKKENNEKEQTLRDSVTYWQNQSNSLQKEIKELKTNNQLLEEKLKQEKENTESVTKELQRAESLLFEVGSEMRLAKEHASASEQLRRDLEHLQKEIILMVELQQKYRDRFAQIPLLRHHEDAADHLQATYCEEIKAMRDMLDIRTSSLEATKARVSELETFLARRDMTIAEQKRVLKQVKEEYQEQLEAIESKYKTQRSITQSLESYVLELHNKLDVIENNSRRKGTRSPDISGAQEVSVASTSSADKPAGASNFSPHSSPLSQSLGSVEGLSLSGMSGAGDIEMKNLQVIIDEPEQLVEATTTSAEQKEFESNSEQESNTKGEKSASVPASPGEDG